MVFSTNMTARRHGWTAAGIVLALVVVALVLRSEPRDVSSSPVATGDAPLREAAYWVASREAGSQQQVRTADLRQSRWRRRARPAAGKLPWWIPTGPALSLAAEAEREIRGVRALPDKRGGRRPRDSAGGEEGDDCAGAARWPRRK
jgi:hypothetical protein